ncbi:MAG: Nif3-like dinuclear metal center hexameric protein, partial [Desulfobacterales bacterium]|nr:Nif3-like dinuclear metal center hexameric protein [Desulfobacterales bacterium]
HTNLDSASGGVNDLLAEKLGLRSTAVLRTTKVDQCKLVVFVPEGHEEQILDVLFESGAGRGERYANVSFRTGGIGTFKPGVTAEPFLGRVGEVAHTAEYRIEAIVAKQDLSRVMNALNKVHPYEEVACDLYATKGGSTSEGLGRIGNVDKEISLEDFALSIKESLQLKALRIVGDPKQTIKRVAVCSGSGKGLLKDFLASDAQAYVSGDLGYHDGRSVEASGRALIDIGHFASEHLVVQGLVARLRGALSKKGFSVQVEGYTEEKDCFQYV